MLGSTLKERALRTSKFTEEQIVGLLREAEKGEEKLEVLCRGRGITVQTYYRWRRKFGGIEVSDVRKMRQLERENSHLKRLLAEREQDIAALKAVVQKKMTGASKGKGGRPIWRWPDSPSDAPAECSISAARMPATANAQRSMGWTNESSSWPMPILAMGIVGSMPLCDANRCS